MKSLALLLALIATPAIAAPPPVGSEDWKALHDYAAWIEAQAGPQGNCCSIADGRLVDVRPNGGHWEVSFLHPETIDNVPRPVAGRWYEVPDENILRAPNPTGFAIAWWHPTYVMGHWVNFVRCLALAGAV